MATLQIARTRWHIKRIMLFAGVLLLVALPLWAGARSFATTSSTEPVTNFQARSWHVDAVYGLIAADANGNVYVVSGSSIVMYSGDAASTTGTNNPTYLKEWTNVPTSGLAVGADGTIYIANNAAGQVGKFSNTLPSGDVSGSVTWWSGFTRPGNLAIDNASGDIVVVQDNGNIRMFNKDELPSGGAPTLTSWSVGADAYVVAIDGSGNIYTGGYSADSINVFPKTTPNGVPTYTTTWTGVQATFKNGLAYADGHVYVGQLANGSGGNWYRFPVSTPAGALGSAKQGIGSTYDPEGVAIDGDGNVYGANWHDSVVMKYIMPQNLADLTFDGKAIHVALPNTASITTHSVGSATTDGAYRYPAGLVTLNFATATAGQATSVDIYFQTGLKPSDVVARKYDTNTHTYSNVTGATVTQTTWGGQPALKLTYSVTDGGAGDQDGTANAHVVDPVGLATAEDPVAITTGTAGAITQTSATISGTATLRSDMSLADIQNAHDVTNHGLYVFTTYSTSPVLDWYNDTWSTAQSTDFVQSLTDPQSYMFTNYLTGLSCGTTYYYQNSWEHYTSTSDDWSWSSDPMQSFTTTACGIAGTAGASAATPASVPGAPDTGGPINTLGSIVLPVLGVLSLVAASVGIVALAWRANRATVSRGK